MHCFNQTKDVGLVLNPNYDVCKLDAYPYADFSGMYVHDKPTDPVYVKIHAGFIVTFLDFPVLWVSKLQIKTARSTMEA